MRYWGVCTAQENWELCKRTLLWGMDWRYFVTLERFLKPGDKAVVYMHGGRFPAVIEFTGNHFYSEEDLGWTKGRSKYLFP